MASQDNIVQIGNYSAWIGQGKLKLTHFCEICGLSQSKAGVNIDLQAPEPKYPMPRVAGEEQGPRTHDKLPNACKILPEPLSNSPSEGPFVRRKVFVLQF